MENETSLGQPIPTAVLTPTEIISPVEASNPEHLSQPFDASSAAEVAGSANWAIEMMFAPFAFWTSVTASYLRLLDIGDEHRAALNRFH